MVYLFKYFFLYIPYNTHKILYLSSALTFPISFLVCWFFPFSIFAIENHTLVSLSIFNPYPSIAPNQLILSRYIYHYRQRYTYVFSMAQTLCVYVHMYISMNLINHPTLTPFKSVATPSTSLDKMYKYVCMNVCIDDDDDSIENC